jgi:hypothetical protein
LKAYLDEQKDFPDRTAVLETKDGYAYYQKTDIYRHLYWYSFDKELASNLIPIPVERVKEIILLNKEGKKVNTLLNPEEVHIPGQDFQDDVGKDSLTRFEQNKRPRKKKNKNKKKKNKQNPGES